MSSDGLVSRIAYHSVYATLCLILVALLLVVPGDFIAQALTTTHQVTNLIVIAIVYVITFLIVIFIYILRLYVTRTVLASIPKPWIPIEKGDVNSEVRGMIVKSLSESAAIAWEARPKVIAPLDAPLTAEEAATRTGSAAEAEAASDEQTKDSHRSHRLFRSRPSAYTAAMADIPSTARRPVWGEVEHDGWASPASPDLANLQYATVLAELPNLIEAKAVAQAPTDPDSVSTAPRFDTDSIALLQRAPSMTMRTYATHLAELRVLPATQDLMQFLDLYERVRFSGRPMSNATFRRLMQLFAELLRSMQPLDSSILHDPRDDSSSHYGFDEHIDDDAPQDSNPTTRTSSPSIHRAGSFDRTRTHAPRNKAQSAASNSFVNTRRQYHTAPTTPRTKAATLWPSRSPSSASSASSFAQSRHPFPADRASNISFGSSSQGSVIRLATAEDTGGLPYVLQLTDTI
ncbi:hypothetical protein F4777DRAFT_559542 [Nemania sp. FL0916]|nr:hypothetical protein F4777DRAFT_559542 [Nemania sp. FL0916]